MYEITYLSDRGDPIAAPRKSDTKIVAHLREIPCTARRIRIAEVGNEIADEFRIVPADEEGSIQDSEKAIPVPRNFPTGLTIVAGESVAKEQINLWTQDRARRQS